jgi:hypothetical protein
MRALAYPQLGTMLVSTLLLTLLAAAFGILQQVEPRRRRVGRSWAGNAHARHVVRRHLRVVWSAEVTPRFVTPLRRGVGGTHGRVPPRSAAGSTLPLKRRP